AVALEIGANELLRRSLHHPNDNAGRGLAFRPSSDSHRDLVTCGRVASVFLAHVNLRTGFAVDSMRAHITVARGRAAKGARDRAVRLNRPQRVIAAELDAALLD